MNIVIEGPDGSGKTTVAKALAEVTKRPYVRCPGSTKLGELLRDTLKNSIDMNPIIRTLLFACVDYDAASSAVESIFDRSGVSGIVYRKANDEQEMLELLQQLAHYDPRFIVPQGSFVVILDADDQTLDKRMNIRNGDKDLGTSFAQGVRSMYRSMPRAVPRVYTDARAIDSIVEEILDMCEEPNEDEILSWAVGL